jgi:hypothetical protein
MVYFTNVISFFFAQYFKQKMYLVLAANCTCSSNEKGPHHTTTGPALVEPSTLPSSDTRPLPPPALIRTTTVDHDLRFGTAHRPPATEMAPPPPPVTPRPPSTEEMATVPTTHPPLFTRRHDSAPPLSCSATALPLGAGQANAQGVTRLVYPG